MNDEVQDTTNKKRKKKRKAGNAVIVTTKPEKQKIKNPTTAYRFYSKQRRAKLKTDQPNLKSTDLTKLVAASIIGKMPIRMLKRNILY